MARSTVLDAAAGAARLAGDAILPLLAAPAANRGPRGALLRVPVLLPALAHGLARAGTRKFMVLTFYLIVASVVGHTNGLLSLYLNMGVPLSLKRALVNGI